MKDKGCSCGSGVLLEFLQRAGDGLWNFSPFTPSADRRAQRKKGACQEQLSRDAEMSITACPWPLGQQQTTAKFSCNCSLCSSFCFWGILLTVAVTISNQEKYGNLETVQRKPGSWYFTYSCYWSRLGTISKVHFSPCLEMHPRSAFHVLGGGRQLRRSTSPVFSNCMSYFLFSAPKDIDLICLENQNTFPPGFFQRTISCPNFTKGSLREIIFWRIVWIIYPSYIPVDQFYPVEPSVMMESLSISAGQYGRH